MAPLCAIEAETLAFAAFALFEGELLHRGAGGNGSGRRGGGDQGGGGGPVLACGSGCLAVLPSTGSERGPKHLSAAGVVVQAFGPVDVLVEGFAGWVACVRF